MELNGKAMQDKSWDQRQKSLKKTLMQGHDFCSSAKTFWAWWQGYGWYQVLASLESGVPWYCYFWKWVPAGITVLPGIFLRSRARTLSVMLSRLLHNIFLIFLSKVVLFPCLVVPGTGYWVPDLKGTGYQKFSHLVLTIGTWYNFSVTILIFEWMWKVKLEK